MQQLDMFSKELKQVIDAKVDRIIDYHRRRHGANFVSQSRLYLFRLKHSLRLYERYGLIPGKVADKLDKWVEH